MNPAHIPHQTGNLLVVEFGDNDFGHYIRDGLDSLFQDTENVYNHSTDMIKQYLIHHVEGEMGKHAALTNWDRPSSRQWLERMKVSFRKELPKWEPDGETIDHDGGSAAIDVVTGYSFTF